MVEIDIGGQVDGEVGFIARMRLHQSWWRTERLSVECGTRVADGETVDCGSRLKPGDAEAGRNFLTPGIRAVADQRIAEGPGVARDRCFANLLSSQPMCFNLFGPLKLDLGLATSLTQALLPGEVDRVTAVEIEFAPSPRSVYLDDHTSFDAFIRYDRAGGGEGFVGIETKLTEPFSMTNPEEKDKKYFSFTEQFDGVWDPARVGELRDRRWYQLWRNHLLVEALRRHDGYSSGRVMVVGHAADPKLPDAVAGYQALLVDPASALGFLTVDQIVEVWSPLVAGTEHEAWLADFNDRYVDLSLSAAAWQALGNG